MTSNPPLHVFVPSAARARRENLMVGVVVALFLAALFATDDNPPPPLSILGLCLGAGLLSFGLYTLRSRLLGPRTVEVFPEGLRLVRGKSSTEVLWRDVTKADHSLYGGERWVFHRKGQRAVMVAMDGLSLDQCEQLNQLIKDGVEQARTASVAS